MDTFDVAVIGMGPGGEEVAGTLAERGLRVLGVERELVGGECPYWGCVPTKMMVRAADSLAEAHRVPLLAGSTGLVTPDWSKVADRIRAEATDTWDDTVAADRFTGKGGVLVRGTGRLVSRTEVDVDGTRYAVNRGIVIASGSSASIPPIPGLSDVDYWTNRHVVEAAELPTSIIVLGGGAIGCEIGQILARFGVTVTIVEAAPSLLPGEEPEVGLILAKVLTADGIDVRTGVSAQRIENGGEGIVVHLADDTEMTAQRILVATGRRVDAKAVGLSEVGVPDDVDAVPVDGHCRVTDGVWAVGDVTGKGAFTHIAMYQASIVIRDILGEEGPSATYDAVPRVTFTDPEVGAVGLTEQQARDQLLPVRVGSTPMPSTARGWIHKEGNDGIIKLVVDADRDVLIGAVAMGPAGGEVLGALTVAVHAQVPISMLRSMIYAYPTFHRGIEDALNALA